MPPGCCLFICLLRGLCVAGCTDLAPARATVHGIKCNDRRLWHQHGAHGNQPRIPLPSSALRGGHKARCRGRRTHMGRLRLSWRSSDLGAIWHTPPPSGASLSGRAMTCCQGCSAWLQADASILSAPSRAPCTALRLRDISANPAQPHDTGSLRERMPVALALPPGVPHHALVISESASSQLPNVFLHSAATTPPHQL
ncbi:hypothetical protein BU16DRAFT_101210 [Lophium mytilinum]|uniref:Secreted protein n=1 Tax=Lophium mytilinum TaxID=390894 RepID=A0A6A6QIV6_9PEZI|nr:hypothetical protein BU16DRAFT_101210 [Lophium mytilinum]